MANTPLRSANAPARLTSPTYDTWQRARPSLYRRYGKRALDIVCSVLLLIILAPVILTIAVAVLITSGTPIFYSAERVGRKGRSFRVHKFRSMVKDADARLAAWKTANPELYAQFEHGYKLKRDPRITSFGRFLRCSSLDELPQLLNVIKGDMSLVGPRPVVQDELTKFGDARFAINEHRPGVTGPWQVGGRNKIPHEVRREMELDYVSNISLARDIRILLATALAPFKYDGL